MTIPPAALAAVLIGAVLHAAWNLLVRSARDRSRETALLVLGASVLALAILPFLPQPHRAAWPFLGISAALHVVYFALIAAVYSRGEVSLAYPLMRGTAPMLTAILAWAVLAEALPIAGWLGIAVICGGVALMARRRGVPGEAAAIRLSLANAVVIAAYTLNDAIGARASGDAVALHALDPPARRPAGADLAQSRTAASLPPPRPSGCAGLARAAAHSPPIPSPSGR